MNNIFKNFDTKTSFTEHLDPEGNNIFSSFETVDPTSQILPPEKLQNYAIKSNIPIIENAYTKETFEKDNSLQGNDIFRSFNILEKNGTINTELNPTMPKTMDKNEIISGIKTFPVSEDRKELALGVAKRESDFNPFIKNRLKYFGLYQFGAMALTDIGMKLEDLLQSIPNQHKAFFKLADLNEKRLLPIINQYVGEVKDGIKITKNGILAAAHLLGAATVKDWFNNTQNTKLAKGGFKDGNGTHLKSYLQLFQ